jgi:hypothetical protein
MADSVYPAHVLGSRESKALPAECSQYKLSLPLLFISEKGCLVFGGYCESVICIHLKAAFF